MDPRRAAPKLPAWVFNHNPELHAYKYYDTAVEAVRNGAKYATDVPEIAPNYPPGYTYEDWNIEQIVEDMMVGKSVDLGPGDWE